MSKHDFIKQKQSDRETTERQRVSGGECCFHYAEDMSSFGSLPSGCLDAGFTIVLLLLSMNSLLFCHMHSNLSTIQYIIRNNIFISTSVFIVGICLQRTNVCVHMYFYFEKYFFNYFFQHITCRIITLGHIHFSF